VIDAHQPHLTPTVAVPQLLSYYVRGNDVDTVIVDGCVLMEGRKVSSVDEEEVIARADEESRRALGRVDVNPYLQMPEGFWTSWTF
ncbi:MAG: amidohydrolase, partial [Clostridia bacterium]